MIDLNELERNSEIVARELWAVHAHFGILELHATRTANPTSAQMRAYAEALHVLMTAAPDLIAEVRRLRKRVAQLEGALTLLQEGGELQCVEEPTCGVDPWGYCRRCHAARALEEP